LAERRDHGQKPRGGGGDGGGSKPWSSSTPDFSITTCARSPAGTGRAAFDWGAGVGVGTATARGGGVELSVDAPRSSARAAGVFCGFGVSSSSRACFAFSAFFDLRAVCFPGDFFAAFGLGVGVWRRFDFDDALGSGVSRGVGDATGSSSSLDFSLVALRSAPGLGDFFGVTEASASLPDLSFASFALGIAVGALSGVAEVRCFLADLLVAVFALGVGDFFGLADEALVSIDSDSSRRLFCSSLTCALRRPVMIAPTASAVASQMRERTTATERNRARDAINSERFRESTESLKKLKVGRLSLPF
jgi:hypothetical protein